VSAWWLVLPAALGICAVIAVGAALVSGPKRAYEGRHLAAVPDFPPEPRAGSMILAEERRVFTLTGQGWAEGDPYTAVNMCPDGDAWCVKARPGEPCCLDAYRPAGSESQTAADLSPAALDDDDDWDGYCTPHCPDDVCRMSGHCAWPKDARTAGQVREGQEGADSVSSKVTALLLPDDSGPGVSSLVPPGPAQDPGGEEIAIRVSEGAATNPQRSTDRSLRVGSPPSLLTRDPAQDAGTDEADEGPCISATTSSVPAPSRLADTGDIRDARLLAERVAELRARDADVQAFMSAREAAHAQDRHDLTAALT